MAASEGEGGGGVLSGGAGPQWRGPAVTGTRCRRTGGFVVQLPKISSTLSSCSPSPACAALLLKRFCLTRFIARHAAGIDGVDGVEGQADLRWLPLT